MVNVDRWPVAAPGTVVSQIGPRIAGSRSALSGRQHRQSRLIAEDSVGRPDKPEEAFGQRPEMEPDMSHSARHEIASEFYLLARVDRLDNPSCGHRSQCVESRQSQQSRITRYQKGGKHRSHFHIFTEHFRRPKNPKKFNDTTLFCPPYAFTMFGDVKPTRSQTFRVSKISFAFSTKIRQSTASWSVATTAKS